MATPPRVGEEATHPDGRVARWDGSAWRIVSGPTRGRNAVPTAGRRIPPQDLQALNTMREQARAAAELERTYRRTGEANERLQPGPYRGTFLRAAIPEDTSGFFDTLMDRIGAITIGGPARIVGAITPQNVEDFQALNRARSEGVLQRQLDQRGVQTESDAARMAMAELAPTNTQEGNRRIINQGVERTQRDQARAAYYARWAATFGGINGTRNSQGMTVEDAWNAYGPEVTRRMFAPRNQRPRATPGRPSIRRIR